MTTRISLDGAWRFREEGGGPWQQGHVPGCVQLDLMALGELPDPFYRTNEVACHELEHKTWTYRRTFALTKETVQSALVELVLEGVDTLAELYFNGTFVLQLENMFVPYHLDVRDLVLVGENTLEVRLLSPVDLPLALQRNSGLDLTATSDPQGILLVDDTGFPKQGRHSVGVARQYCGALGKVANCQIGVSLTYVGQGAAWPYAMNLFIPPSWDDLEDPQCVWRRQKTRMPPGARHREKWRMALEMIEQARQAGVPHRGVAADAWYGNVTEFRRQLAEWGEWYVVGVNANTEVFWEAPVFEEIPAPPRGGRPRKYRGCEEISFKQHKNGVCYGRNGRRDRHRRSACNC